MLTQSTSEEEEGNLEHQREALDEEVEGPLLESIAFALAISATLDHRSANVPQVPVEPLLAQHRDECGEQGDQETRVHESSDCDDLTGRIFHGWNGGGFVRDGGLVEGEKDRAEKSCGLFVRIGLEARVDIDDEGGADGGKQTRLRERVSWLEGANDTQRTKIKVVLRSSSHFPTKSMSCSVASLLYIV